MNNGRFTINLFIFLFVLVMNAHNASKVYSQPRIQSLFPFRLSFGVKIGPGDIGGSES